MQRRQFISEGIARVAGMGGAAAAGAALLNAGCVPSIDPENRLPDLVWGRRGLSDGRLMKPRAMTLSNNNEIYLVDITGRIQVFDTEGEYKRGWRTPFIKQGKPTGLGWSNDNLLLVADTHYFRVLFYTPEGERVETISIGGTNGDGPGEFHFVTDVVQDARGHYFVGQYGQIDLIQEFDPEGTFIKRWGKQGGAPEDFSRPQALLIDEAGFLWVADACNHRIKIYDVTGEKEVLVEMWGEPGRDVGQLMTPYGMDFDQDGTLVVAEFGNHRVQRFKPNGESLGCFGKAGHDPGQFYEPWALIMDSDRNLHVLDTKNHRLQRFPIS